MSVCIGDATVTDYSLSVVVSCGKNIDLSLKTTLLDDRDISNCQHSSTSPTTNPHGDVWGWGGGRGCLFLLSQCEVLGTGH